MAQKTNNNEVVTIELTETKELKKFDKLYKTTGDNMREMCRLAHTIVNGDNERKRLFIEHIVALGMSKATGSNLLLAGRIYNANANLIEMSHTNIVELRKVASDVTGELNEDFYEKTNTTPEKLVAMSQKRVRETVNKYLTDEDDADEETTDGEETTDELKIDIKPLFDALNMAITTLDIIDTRYNSDMEKDDLKLIHDTLFEMKRAIKNVTVSDVTEQPKRPARASVHDGNMYPDDGKPKYNRKGE